MLYGYMWTSQQDFINSDNTCRISISKQNRIITYSEAIALWQEDFSFRTFFISLLADCPYEAYFWETPSITTSTCDRNFEFVLVNNPRLAEVKANSRSFEQYFKLTEDVVTFANLRKDALLVVPCPVADTSAYPHLAAFTRNAPPQQQHLLWQTAGKQIEQQINRQPLWVSTSGLGVYWLHIRLDSYPKYYSHKLYKTNPI